MSKLKIVNPLQEEIVKLGEKTTNMQHALDKVGEQYIKMSDFINRSNLTNVTLAYLFAHGVNQFKFIRVLTITPKHHRLYLDTDKGYVIVDINNENEKTVMWSDIVDYEHFKDDIRSYLTLMREMSPPYAVKEIEEEIKRWS